MKGRGYFAIGVVHGKCEANIGTLWRHATLYGASFIFTVGARYRHQASDTQDTWKHIPLFNFECFEDLHRHLPHSCPLVAVEMCDEAKALPEFTHEERACYLLGAEDHGLPKEALAKCHRKLIIPCPTDRSMNVAVAGTLVMYDRYLKIGRKVA